MGLLIKEIEDLVLTQLDAAPLNVYCENFERYDGQFSVDDVNSFKASYPACFVAYTGDRFLENTALIRYTVDMGISVVVVAKNLRGDFQAKTGSAGAYQMLEDVKTLLHLNNLNIPNLVGMVLQRRTNLVNTKNLAVFVMDFSLQFVD